ncbi:MAG: UDP-N-acetylmuramate dehydrogenase [Acidobacteriota bacterium]|nr:UDP-N-acetylmuramate dehydrogenase [Acidobacteriota bacterium]
MDRAGRVLRETYEHLVALPRTTVLRDEPLSGHTRFGIGGPADLFASTDDISAFMEASKVARASGLETVVIGGGTNLIVCDEGFRGVVLKLANAGISAEGETVSVASGVPLQTLVDFTVDAGLKGIETMTGIPGSTGAAVYGNAGAYGHSMMERVSRVHFFDGAGIRQFNNAECEFHYRESVFKRNKDWIVISTELGMERGDAAQLREKADGIRATRDKKYPRSMKCAGSIFKNFLLAELPASVADEIPAATIIEGKVPSAWFLQQVNARGMRAGDIQVADYHANLIYNDGHGTACDLVGIIDELKRRVEERWGIALQEEVQYVGFAKIKS